MTKRGSLQKNKRVPKVKEMKEFSPFLKLNMECLRLISSNVCDMFDLDMKKCEKAKFGGYDLAFARSTIAYISKRFFRIDNRALALYFGWEKEADPEGDLDQAIRVMQKKLMQAKFIIGTGKGIANTIRGRPDMKYDKLVYEQIFNYAIVNDGKYETLYDLLTGRKRKAVEYENEFKQFNEVKVVKNKGLVTK